MVAGMMQFNNLLPDQHETRTSYSVQQGMVTISKIENGIWSGFFEGRFTLNGEN